MYHEGYSMQKKKSPVASAFVLVLQFGINMIVPIALMSLLGWWIGEKTGISWMMIPFFFIGAIAGGNSIYLMSKKTIGKEDKKTKNTDDKQTKKME